MANAMGENMACMLLSHSVGRWAGRVGHVVLYATQAGVDRLILQGLWWRICVFPSRRVMLHVQEHLKESRSTESSATEKSSRPWYKPLWRFPRSWADVKRLGWKFILAFILFYLIRDTILYIIIPYLVYKGIISL